VFRGGSTSFSALRSYEDSVPAAERPANSPATGPDWVTVPLAGVYRPVSARDHETARRVSAFIAERRDAFDRANADGHVTASAFVVNAARDAVLLTHHAKLDCWLQLGGHCDGIRDPRFVALKEAYEESNLTLIRPVGDAIFDIDIHTIPAADGMPAHDHLDIRYLFQADDAEPLHATSESKALRWVGLDELPEFTTRASVLILRDKMVTT